MLHLLFVYSSTDFLYIYHMFFISSVLDKYVTLVDNCSLVHHVTEYKVHELDHNGGYVAFALLDYPAN